MATDLLRRTPARALAGAVCAALLGTGCAGPTLSHQAVVEQAVKSADAMVSELRTVELVAGGARDGKVWWRYADVVVTQSESAAGTIAATFGSRQPPTPASDKVYDETSSELSDAADLVTELRVAVRRHDAAEVGRLGDQVAAAADDLEQLAEGLG